MMKIINYFSLLSMFFSMLYIFFNPKIKLPIHVDAILLMLAIGAAAIFINTVLGSDLYGQLQNAEIMLRFGFACLLIRYAYQCHVGAKK